MLAYISIFYGMSGVDLSLEPVFGENIKEGSIFLKGNICIFSVLVIALRVYRNEQLFPDREGYVIMLTVLHKTRRSKSLSSS